MTMDKPVIYVITASEADIKADMIMKTHKFLWKILFANQRSCVSLVFFAI